MINADNEIISGLNPRYFRDVDVLMLNDTSSSRLIIERVFTIGDVHEMNRSINLLQRLNARN